MEIKVTSVDAMDEISIRTQRSEYRFCVTDPTRLRGILTGGLLGDLGRDAFFGGAIPQDADRPDWSTLKTGTCSVFFLEANGKVERMTTSVIAELARVPATYRSCSSSPNQGRSRFARLLDFLGRNAS